MGATSLRVRAAWNISAALVLCCTNEAMRVTRLRIVRRVPAPGDWVLLVSESDDQRSVYWWAAECYYTMDERRLAMTDAVLGIHHITAICGEAQANVDFYAGVLGLRLV